MCLLLLLLDHLEDLGFTSIDDGDSGAPEILTAGCAEVLVVALEWEDIATAEHSIVFDKGLVCWGDIASEDDELGFSTSEGLKSLGNSEAVLAGLCDEAKAADDGFTSSGQLLSSHLEKDRPKPPHTNGCIIYRSVRIQTV